MREAGKKTRLAFGAIRAGVLTAGPCLLDGKAITPGGEPAVWVAAAAMTAWTGVGPRLLVPGEPASGKSHLATTLAQWLARRDRERHALVLDLGVWNPEANEDVALHAARTARRGLHPGTDPPPEPELHTLIHQGRVLVVLDGLDRVRPVWRPTALAVIEDFGAALADAYARLGRVRRLRHLAEVGRGEEAIDPLRGRGHPGVERDAETTRLLLELHRSRARSPT